MSPGARERLQAAMALLEECRRQIHLTGSLDVTVQAVAFVEALLTASRARFQIESVLRDEEEKAA